MSITEKAHRINLPGEFLIDDGLRQALIRPKDKASKKRQTRKRERIAAHYKLLMMKFFNAIGAPDIAFDYCAGLVAVLGFDDSLNIELHDEEFARVTLGSTHWLNKEDWQTRINREVARRRKQRQRIMKWQSEKDVPLLFEFDNSFDKKSPKPRRNAKYTLHFIEPIRELAGDVEPGATDDRIDRAVRVRASEYHERFTGEAHVLTSKQIQSPESVAHRCATYLKNAMAAAAASKDEIGEVRGEQGAIDLFFDEFLSNIPVDDFTFLRIFEKVKILQEKTLNSVCSETNVPDDETELSSKSAINITADFNGLSEGSLPEPIQQQTVAAKSFKRSSNILGVASEQFIASNPAYHFSPKPASARRSERTAEWLSLAKLQQFDHRGGSEQGHEKRFCCPECGHDKPLDADHRSLSANDQTGAYFCHRCEAKGVLREFLSEPTAIIPARSFPAPKPPQTENKAQSDNKWREHFAKVKPIAGAGAAYLESRGIPADVAAAAGVRFGTWWTRNDVTEKPEQFQAVIFPIQDAEGRLVAAQARAITGDLKRTRGERKTGIFEATPGALEAPRLALCEAPIDALALAAVGLPAIAFCGADWPEWLPEYLAGREVIIATDADDAGDKIAAGWPASKRLRPRGGKDWAEVAQKHGLDSVVEQVDAVLGAAGSDEMNEFEN
jgi:hypothetical protein